MFGADMGRDDDRSPPETDLKTGRSLRDANHGASRATRFRVLGRGRGVV